MGGTASQIGESRIVNQGPLLLQDRETAGQDIYWATCGGAPFLKKMGSGRRVNPPEGLLAVEEP